MIQVKQNHKLALVQYWSFMFKLLRAKYWACKIKKVPADKGNDLFQLEKMVPSGQKKLIILNRNSFSLLIILLARPSCLWRIFMSEKYFFKLNINYHHISGKCLILIEPFVSVNNVTALSYHNSNINQTRKLMVADINWILLTLIAKIRVCMDKWKVVHTFYKLGQCITSIFHFYDIQTHKTVFNLHLYKHGLFWLAALLTDTAIYSDG